MAPQRCGSRNSRSCCKRSVHPFVFPKEADVFRRVWQAVFDQHAVWATAPELSVVQFQTLVHCIRVMIRDTLAPKIVQRQLSSFGNHQRADLWNWSRKGLPL